MAFMSWKLFSENYECSTRLEIIREVYWFPLSFLFTSFVFVEMFDLFLGSQEWEK